MILGIISDIHEDIESLKKAITICEKHNCDELACLGDVSGFDRNFYKYEASRDLSNCITILKKEFKYVVSGNHDLYSLRKLPQKNNSNFIFPDNWYDLGLDERKLLGNNKLCFYDSDLPNGSIRRRDIEFLDSLPESIVIEADAKRVLLSHYVFPDFTGSSLNRIHNSWELRNHLSYMDQNKISLGFCGHMHISGLMSGDANKIKDYTFGNFSINNNLTQYFCPSIANSDKASGLVIADLNQMLLKIIRIKQTSNIFHSIYERLSKIR